MILLAEIHNGFHNKNHKDIEAVDIVVRNTAVVAVVLRIEATKVHIVDTGDTVYTGDTAVAVAVLLGHTWVAEGHIEDTGDTVDIQDTVYTAVAVAVVLQEHIEDTVDIHDTGDAVVLQEHTGVAEEHIEDTVYIEEGN